MEETDFFVEKTIEDAFRKLMKECYSSVEKGSVQWREQRRTFFASVAWFLSRVSGAIKSKEENPLRELIDELKMFIEQEKQAESFMDQIRKAWEKSE